MQASDGRAPPPAARSCASASSAKSRLRAMRSSRNATARSCQPSRERRLVEIRPHPRAGARGDGAIQGRVARRALVRPGRDGRVEARDEQSVDRLGRMARGHAEREHAAPGAARARKQRRAEAVARVREAQPIGARQLLGEIEQAVPARREARREARPGGEAHRRHAAREPRGDALRAPGGEMRQPAGPHQRIDHVPARAVEAEDEHVGPRRQALLQLLDHRRGEGVEIRGTAEIAGAARRIGERARARRARALAPRPPRPDGAAASPSRAASPKDSRCVCPRCRARSRAPLRRPRSRSPMLLPGTTPSPPTRPAHRSERMSP